MMLIIATLLVAMFTYLVARGWHHESGESSRFSLKRLWWRPSVYGAIAAAIMYAASQLMNGHLIGGLVGWLLKIPRSFIYIWLWYLLFGYIDNRRASTKGATSSDVAQPYPIDPFEGGHP